MILLLAAATALAADPVYVPDAALGDTTVMALDAERTVFTEDARVGDGFVARADAWWVRDPMLWIFDSGEVKRLVGDALALQPAAVGWAGPVRLGAAAPVYLSSDGDALGSQGAVLGDARLDLKVVVPLGGNGGIAPLGRLFVPLGADSVLLGRSGVSWEAGLAGDLLVGSTLLALDVGTRGVPPDELTGLTIDDQLWYKAAGSFAVGQGYLGVELQGHTQYNAFFGSVSASPLEGLLSGSAPIGPHTRVRGAIGTGLVGGVGAPALRIALGIAYGETPTDEAPAHADEVLAP